MSLETIVINVLLTSAAAKIIK